MHWRKLVKQLQSMHVCLCWQHVAMYGLQPCALKNVQAYFVQKIYYACCWCQHLAMQELLSCKAHTSRVQGTLACSTQVATY